MKDSALIKEIRSGSHRAFSDLMDKHIRRIRGFLALRAPVPHLVDEIAHETFVFAYKNINDYTENKSFHAWLCAIAHNLLRAEVQRYCREEKQRNKYAEHCHYLLAREQVGKHAESTNDFYGSLENCLERLPKNLRELVQLRYQQSRSSSSISKALDRSLPWVRTTLFRVREKLKECIEKNQLA